MLVDPFSNSGVAYTELLPRLFSSTLRQCRNVGCEEPGAYIIQRSLRVVELRRESCGDAICVTSHRCSFLYLSETRKSVIRN